LGFRINNPRDNEAGANAMNEEMNIYQRINAVMEEDLYVRKGSAGQGTGVNYDDVIPLLAPAMRKHGIVQVITQTSMVQIHEKGNQRIYQGEYKLELVNIDKPEDRATYTAFAQGMDGGDKAPGKAHTYAAKIMLVKAFMLETGDNEESRSEILDKKKTISQEQYMKLSPYCLTEDLSGWTQLGARMANAYNIQGLDQLPSSKFTEAMARCEKTKEAK
jgi:hypothetical protein